jgi:ribosome-associated protein
MNNRDIAIKTAQALKHKKAQDVVVIDITDKSSFADYLVIGSGTSERQVGTLVSLVEDKLAIEGACSKNVEGSRNSGWVLLDYGDIIVNIFTKEQRERYNLEKIWADGSYLDIE